MDDKYCLLSIIPKTIQSTTTAFTIKTVMFKKIRYVFRSLSRHQAKQLQKCTKEGRINSWFDWIFPGIIELL